MTPSGDVVISFTTISKSPIVQHVASYTQILYTADLRSDHQSQSGPYSEAHWVLAYTLDGSSYRAPGSFLDAEEFTQAGQTKLPPPTLKVSDTTFSLTEKLNPALLQGFKWELSVEDQESNPKSDQISLSSTCPNNDQVEFTPRRAG